jgi:Ca2+-binding RTX toxin-like protein
MAMGLRKLGAGLMAIPLAVAAVLIAPASASAVEVRMVQIESKIVEVDLTDTRDVPNVIAITAVTPSGGSPDLVIGDTTAGIPDPIPSVCARIDPEIIRCPADLFGVQLEIKPVLRGGKDEFTITLDVNPVISDLTEVHASLGKGADTVRDFSEFMDFFVGGFGADTMIAGPGRDKVKGGPGPDKAKGGPGRDLLLGGGQNDLLLGGANRDVIDCGAGPHDIGVGGPGRDLGKNCEVVKH